MDYYPLPSEIETKKKAAGGGRRRRHLTQQKRIYRAEWNGSWQVWQWADQTPRLGLVPGGGLPLPLEPRACPWLPGCYKWGNGQLEEPTMPKLGHPAFPCAGHPNG